MSSNVNAVAFDESGPPAKVHVQAPVVFADNVGNLIEALVGKRGKSTDYLEYVRNHKNFQSKNIKTNLEYSNAEDAVEISTYRVKH